MATRSLGEEQRLLTLVALADVDAGRIVGHTELQLWVARYLLREMEIGSEDDSGCP